MNGFHFFTHIFLIVTIMTGCSQVAPQRFPAQEESLVRSAMISPRNGERYVLLGIKDPNGIDLRQFCVRDKNCFEGKDIGSVEPRFLISVNKSGPEKVYSFTQGRFIKSEGSPWPGAKVQFYPDPARVPSLPHPLLDVRFPKIHNAARALALATAAIVPIAGDIWMEVDRKIYSYQIQDAVALERMLRHELDSKGALTSFLSSNEILSILASINIEYHPDGLGSSLSGAYGVDDRIADYEVFKAKKETYIKKNLAKMTDWANRTNTVIIPFGERFALVAWDKTKKIPLSEIEEMQEDQIGLSMGLLDRKKLKEDQEREEKIAGVQKLVPLGVIDLGTETMPSEILDFEKPGFFELQATAKHLSDFFTRLTVDFIPIQIFYMGLQVSKEGLKFYIKKKGKAVAVDRLRSYSDLRILISMGLVHIDPEEFTKDILVEYMGLPPEKANALTKKDLSEFLLKGASEELSDGQETVKEKIAIQVKRFKLLLEKRGLPKIREPFIPDARKEEKELSLLVDEGKTSLTNRPVIAFLVDGLSKEHLDHAMKHDLMPTVKEIFVQNGLFLESYTSRSITLPSWSTILTGLEPDEHGTRSNSPAQTLPGTKQEDLIDFRKELITPSYIKTSRSLQRIREAGAEWIVKDVPPEQTIINFMPLNDQNYPSVFSLLKTTLTELRSIIYGSHNGTDTLDTTSARLTAHAIEKHPGKHRLVINWYAGIDHNAHAGNSLFSLLGASKEKNPFMVIDQSIRKILIAAKKDPVLKDAVIFLISDHGHHGHVDKSKNNTNLNLTRLFAGDYPEMRNFNFVVQAASSPDPDHDLTYLKEFFIQPFTYVYPRNGKPDLILDYSGDRLAQVYLKKEEWGPERRHSYFDLVHHKKGDLINLLLKFELRNTETLEQGGQRGNPIQFVALPLASKEAQEGVREWLQDQDLENMDFDRPPVIVQAKDQKIAMVLTKKSVTGEDLFSYIVIDNFYQTPDGKISGEISSETHKDPFGYIGVIDSTSNLIGWHTDREWLMKARNHKFPSAPFSLVRTLTVSKRLASPRWEAETPDFLLVASDHFNFNSGSYTESDHGGLLANEVRTTFAVGALKKGVVKKKLEMKEPAMIRDVAPTILNVLGIPERAVGMHGKNLVPYLLENSY
jgi:hypothetical protein